MIEAPEDKAEAAAKWVRDAMEAGMREYLRSVPVVVETTIGKTYGG